MAKWLRMALVGGGLGAIVIVATILAIAAG